MAKPRKKSKADAAIVGLAANDADGIATVADLNDELLADSADDEPNMSTALAADDDDADTELDSDLDDDFDDEPGIDLGLTDVQCSAREASIRRAIEERREARRLQDDLDYLDIDD